MGNFMKVISYISLAGYFVVSTALVACHNGGSGVSSAANSLNNATSKSKNIVQQVSATSAPRVLGYYTNWSTYGANYQPSNIPSQVNTVLYAFAQVGSCAAASNATDVDPSRCLKQVNDNNVVLQSGIQDWKLHTTDAWSDFYTYKNLEGTNIGGLGNIAKTLASGKDVLLSIGGWTLSAPLYVAIDDQHRASFVQSIIDFMRQAEADASSHGVTNRFAGVDVDWEPNGNLWTLPAAAAGNKNLTKTDLVNYYLFLADLKKALMSNGYSKLSIAMTANPNAISHVDSIYGGSYWQSIAKLGIELNLMTYDYNGQAFAGTCSYTQFNSPLFKDPVNPCTQTANFNVTDSFNSLKASGVPNNQIGVGIPAYGRAYAVDNTNSITVSNPYAVFVGGTAATAMNNVAIADFGAVWTNRNILTGRAYGGISTSEDTTWTFLGSYLPAGQSIATAYANYTSPAFISFSSYADAQNLMSFAKTNGLAGVMVWELDQDVQPGDTFANGVALPWNTTSIVAGLAAMQ